MTSATIAPPRPRATATTTVQPSRHPAEPLAKHVEQGQALLDQARLVGDISDYQCWRAARNPWIELTTETLRDLYGSEEADKFKSAASALVRGGRWQTEHKRESKCIEVAIDVLVSLQGRPEFEQEPSVDSELALEPAGGPVLARDAREPSPGLPTQEPDELAQELEELAQELQELAPVSSAGPELAQELQESAGSQVAPAPSAGSELAPAPSVGVVAQEPAEGAEVVKQAANGSSLPTMATADPMPDGTRQVLLVHGTNETWKLAVAGLLERASPNEVAVLNEPSSDRGELVQQWDGPAVGLRYAVVLLTADDIGAPRLDSDDEPYYSPRARQNVVFKMGFLVAALGPRCVCVLYEDGVELPCDLDGIGCIRLDRAGTWQSKLLLTLRSAGFDYDLNRLAPV